jgi:proline dehydrogenase
MSLVAAGRWLDGTLTLSAMSIARSVLLRASRSTWLADQFRRRSFAKRAARKFMPGEDVGSALEAARVFASSGLGTVLTSLGERVTERAEADAVRDHYLGVFDAIAKGSLPTHVSVKLSHLGLDIDRGACLDRIRQLAARAVGTGSFLWIDIEESWYVDATLDIYHQVRSEYERVGVCLQAYLRRTPADLDALLPLEPAIRLVKGAYRESAAVAFPKKRDTDAAYYEIADRLLAAAAAGGAFPVFGTHDLKLIDRIRSRASVLALAKGAYEIHMLYGIKTAQQRALSASGVAVRVLVSYGEHWFPWYVRRLAERPANVWFVVKSLVS